MSTKNIPILNKTLCCDLVFSPFLTSSFKVYFCTYHILKGNELSCQTGSCYLADGQKVLSIYVKDFTLD
jgi:hypothetical protein